jgi:hypothetical protein
MSTNYTPIDLAALERDNQADERLLALPPDAPREVRIAVANAESTFRRSGEPSDLVSVYTKDGGLPTVVPFANKKQGQWVMFWLLDLCKESEDNDFVSYLDTTSDGRLHLIVMAPPNLDICFCPIQGKELGEWTVNRF